MSKKNTTNIHEETGKLFLSIDDAMQLTQNINGVFFYKGRALTWSEYNDIIYEAKTILSLPLFEILIKDLEYAACKKMYKDGGDDLELLKGGKWMLFTIDILKKKLEKLSNLPIKQVVEKK